MSLRRSAMTSRLAVLVASGAASTASAYTYDLGVEGRRAGARLRPGPLSKSRLFRLSVG